MIFTNFHLYFPIFFKTLLMSRVSGDVVLIFSGCPDVQEPYNIQKQSLEVYFNL